MQSIFNYNIQTMSKTKKRRAKITYKVLKQIVIDRYYEVNHGHIKTYQVIAALKAEFDKKYDLKETTVSTIINNHIKAVKNIENSTYQQVS